MSEASPIYDGPAVLAGSNGDELEVTVKLYVQDGRLRGVGQASASTAQALADLAACATVVLMRPDRSHANVTLELLGNSTTFEVRGTRDLRITRQLPNPSAQPAQAPEVYHPPNSYPPSMQQQPPAAAAPQIYVNVAPTPRSGGVAAAGMVCGIVSVLCCGVLSLPGLLLSVGGYMETHKGNSAGAGMAIAGIILNGLVLLGWGIVWFIVLAT